MVTVIKKIYLPIVFAALLFLTQTGCTSNTENVQNLANIENNTTSPDTNNQAESNYPSNSDGQTYGVYDIFTAYDEAVAGQDLNALLPDLVFVTADNGESGYANRYDYIIGYRFDIAAEPDAASIIYNMEPKEAIDGFCKYYYETTGQVADTDQVELVFREIEAYAQNSFPPWSMLSEQLQISFENLQPEEYRTPEHIQAGYKAVLHSNDFAIPVFAQDGQTKIGELTLKR